MRIYVAAEFYLLRLVCVLEFPLLLLLLLLLVDKLAEIDNPAYRRSRIVRNKRKIQPALLRKFERPRKSHYPKLTSIGTNKTNFPTAEKTIAGFD